MTKDYKKYNKSVWFLLPLISRIGTTKKDYLIDSHLINTYIRGDKDHKDSNLLYVKYKVDVNLVSSVEELLSNEYLVEIEDHPGYSIYIYNISDTSIYNMFLEGKYSELPAKYKIRIIEFFNLSQDHFIYRLFRKDIILWHDLYKKLGCMKEKCSCLVNTKYSTEFRREVFSDEQKYLDCKNFSPFKMPKNIELEEKPDLKLETLI